MINHSGKNTTREKDSAKIEGTMDRRDFFMTAGKLIIPTLGVLGLSMLGGKTAQAAGCKDCASNCTRSCIGSCTSTCEGWAKGMVK